jgi:integrase
MARERTGSIKYQKTSDTYLVRITYTDDLGHRHDLRRQAGTITEAKTTLKKLKRDLEEYGPALIDGEKMTFDQLAEIYEEKKVQPPVYKGETRIGGLRSWRALRSLLRPLKQHFGRKRVRAITHADIEEYKTARLQTPVTRKRINEDDKEETITIRDRSTANVNRELALMRAILNFAKRSGWVTRTPFEMGESLISIADEVRRDRILTRDEEAELLTACEGPRAHLKPLLIFLLDTACRRGEAFQLKWSDVDLENGLIRVRKTTTKTWEARTIGLTARVREELERLRDAAPPGDGLVFGITNNVKRSFATACRLAGIEGFRLHDCRHVATTRMIAAGLPPLQVMKITGHKQMTTFLRYMNTDQTTARDAATALDQLHALEAMQATAQDAPTVQESELIN